MRRDASFHELLQQEIDGANTEAESVELRALVERDAAARLELEQLRRLAATLDRVEPLEPPPGLRREILDILGRRRGARSGLVGRLFGTGARSGAGLRYAYAVAAGALLGVLGYHAVSGGFSTGKLNGDDLVGTIGGTRQQSTIPLTQLNFDVEGAHGSAAVLPAEGGFDIRVAVDSADPLEVVLEFDPGQLGFVGFRQPLSDSCEFRATAEGIRFLHPGGPAQTVRLAPRNEGPAEVALRFVRGGRLLHESQLQLPGQGDPRSKTD